MGAPKRKPSTIKQKQVEQVNKKALYWTIGSAAGLVLVIAVLLIIFS